MISPKSQKYADVSCRKCSWWKCKSRNLIYSLLVKESNCSMVLDLCRYHFGGRFLTQIKQSRIAHVTHFWASLFFVSPICLSLPLSSWVSLFSSYSLHITSRRKEEPGNSRITESLIAVSSDLRSTRVHLIALLFVLFLFYLVSARLLSLHSSYFSGESLHSFFQMRRVFFISYIDIWMPDRLKREKKKSGSRRVGGKNVSCIWPFPLAVPLREGWTVLNFPALSFSAFSKNIKK